MESITSSLASNFMNGMLANHAFELIAAALTGFLTAFIIPRHDAIRTRIEKFFARKDVSAGIDTANKIKAAVKDGELTGLEVKEIWESGLSFYRSERE